MSNVGVFVDVSNLYYCANQKYGKKVNYQKYLEFIKEYGEIMRATAYGAQVKDEAHKFISFLEHAGFTTKYKEPKEFKVKGTDEVRKRKADWDVGITIDIVDMCLGVGVDTIFLGTADGDLKPLVDWCVRRGHKVVVLACGISRELKESATKWIELPESMLETDDQ